MDYMIWRKLYKITTTNSYVNALSKYIAGDVPVTTFSLSKLQVETTHLPKYPKFRCQCEMIDVVCRKEITLAT